MDKAVEALDKYMQGKPVHNVLDVSAYMTELCSYGSLFTSPSRQQGFAQTCHNFHVYCIEHGVESISSGQFEAWWNSNLNDGADFEVDLAPSQQHPRVNYLECNEDLPPWEDPPQAVAGEQQVVEFTSLEVANTYIRSMDEYIKQLESDKAALMRTLASIQELTLNPYKGAGGHG